MPIGVHTLALPLILVPGFEVPGSPHRFPHCLIFPLEFLRLYHFPKVRKNCGEGQDAGQPIILVKTLHKFEFQRA